MVGRRETEKRKRLLDTLLVFLEIFRYGKATESSHYKSSEQF